jgi:uncharacterized protein (DUF1697 family)
VPKLVAFLRGINVGGHRVQMARLRDEFEGLGFTGVETFIASGNVIFQSARQSLPALETRIEQRLAAALGYAVPTLVRTPSEVQAVVERLPFTSDEAAAAHAIHVLFLRVALDADGEARVRALETPMDAFRPSGRELYWLCRGRLNESLVPAPAFARALGRQPATMRNVTMLKRLAAKL